MAYVLEPGTHVRIHPDLYDKERFPRHKGPGLVPDMLNFAGKEAIIKRSFLIGNERRYTLYNCDNPFEFVWIADWFDLEDYEETDSCASISEDHEMLDLI